MKASNTSNVGKKGSNFLVLNKDMDDSSSEDDNETVSTFNDDKEPQMFDHDEKELPNKGNDDDNDVMTMMRTLIKKMMTKMKTLMMTSVTNTLILMMTMMVFLSYKMM